MLALGKFPVVATFSEQVAATRYLCSVRRHFFSITLFAFFLSTDLCYRIVTCHFGRSTILQNVKVVTAPFICLSFNRDFDTGKRFGDSSKRLRF